MKRLPFALLAAAVVFGALTFGIGTMHQPYDPSHPDFVSLVVVVFLGAVASGSGFASFVLFALRTRNMALKVLFFVCCVPFLLWFFGDALLFVVGTIFNPPGQ